LVSGVLSSVEYAQGHLFYQQQGTLMAHSFDETSGTISGDAMPLVENIRFNPVNGRAAFSVSPTGALAYRTGDSNFDVSARQITWLDASGKPISTVGGPGAYSSATVSPNGAQLAVVEDSQDSGARIIHLFDERGLRTRFTTGSGDEFRPIWTRDGSFLVFGSVRDGRNGLFRRAAGGAATSDEILFAATEQVLPTSFSSDGKQLLFIAGNPGSRRAWVLPVDGADRKPLEAFPGSTNDVSFAAFSPDDKWIVYTSREGSGTENVQVYVQPFPGDGRLIRISATTGYQPRWTADQRRIIYRTFDGTLEAVPLTVSAGTLVPGQPTRLFPARKIGRLNWNWEMNDQGDRFLLVLPPERQEEAEPPPITVIVNWTSTLVKK
jgi:WD40 repeat protein